MTSPVTKPDPNYVRIFDTTLRDGEQSPGATMTSEEKLEVARALSRLGVDVIEAGFPSASPDDFGAVKEIAKTIGNDVPQGRILRSVLMKPETEEHVPRLHDQVLDLLAEFQPRPTA